ncbi:hypothetical protein [Methylophilus aquaticus]|uniref:Uncharacterized protein n=1 Tax=Methylophilus aquaticus TaxID=1971610 RepID=A0ABT9JT85_9PROT|nr:hypothetical protein [Methylophilus aquaticus]MDP8567325.1 hypothetical protein [Methylophilus aquaticus]
MNAESRDSMQPKSIQQINLSYDTQQDRLMLRAGMSDGSEIQVWITYRITRQLFAVLNREANLPVAPAGASESTYTQSAAPAPGEATRQFAEEAVAMESLESLDFNTAYEERMPVVEQGPLLAVGSQFQAVNAQLRSMTLHCLNHMNVNINLTKELVLAIARMLLIAAKDAGWTLQSGGEPGTVSAIVVQGTPEKQVLH